MGAGAMAPQSRLAPLRGVGPMLLPIAMNRQDPSAMTALVARVALIALLAVGMAGAAGCHKRPAIDPNFPATPEDFARARSFEVKPGMKRDHIEGIFGIPQHITRGKEGEVLCHYQLENTWRSVQYDDSSRAVVVYP